MIQLFAFLLRYPDDEVLAGLSEASEAAKSISDESQRQRCRRLIRYLRDTPLLQVQEAYTAAFDMNPKLCLNLTYHRWGDGKERGDALAAFTRMYLERGYAPAATELPDYLPMILEMFSVTEPAPLPEPVAGCLPEIESIADRLRKTDSPWSGIMAGVVDLFTPLSEPRRCAS
jgi:nitrate reductase delta subunit